MRLTNNKGLAAAFQAGLDACLKLGADVIVNTDADNQYYGGDIPKLVAPILAGRGRHGDRRPRDRPDRALLPAQEAPPAARQRRRAARLGHRRPDATSGFRAYNREAALQIQVVSKFTYTLESIIQAGKMPVAVEHVPIRTNPQTRESRLFPSMWAYVRRNAVVDLPHLRALRAAARVLRRGRRGGSSAALIWARFLWFFFSGEGEGHVQSLILGSTLFVVAVQLAALGVVGDILAGSRVLQQRILERVRRVELHAGRRALPLRAGRGARAGGHHRRRSRPATGKTEEREALEA